MSETPAEQTGETTEMRPVVGAGYSLVVVNGVEGAQGRLIRLDPPSSSIGRDPDSQVHIDVRAVSRRHAEIRFKDGRLFVVHHSAVNQTFVNGVVVEGQTVTRDESLGLSGRSGNATGPHLHFEISGRGHRVDPGWMRGGPPG